jgi:site-specific recombinase XerD
MSYRFDAFLDGISDISRVTADDLRRFIVDMRQRTTWQGTDQARPEPVSSTTVNTYIKRIIAFWTWLEREKIIKKNGGRKPDLRPRTKSG